MPHPLNKFRLGDDNSGGVGIRYGTAFIIITGGGQIFYFPDVENHANQHEYFHILDLNEGMLAQIIQAEANERMKLRQPVPVEATAP